MKIKTKQWLLLCILCAVFLSGCAGDTSKEETAPAPKEESAETITFEAMDLEGNAVTSEICADSRLTMINVWATYCNPCLSEMPELGELAKEYKAEDFQLLGIVSDVLEEEDEEMLAYAADLVEETEADYPHLLLNESLYKGMLQDVSAVPTTFFLNKEGEILDVVVGAMDKSRWKEKIDGLLEDL
ncbi:MAG: TlpA family protein disulfide reductase [Lachnospiraceae bacterium]|jgi:thiol-disulfide isomerase/thioredoxin|nr:TlpA family protein disulfide reductase [Lachnospiraceae bacterium]